jgi:hypothetical protein
MKFQRRKGKKQAQKLASLFLEEFWVKLKSPGYVSKDT